MDKLYAAGGSSTPCRADWCPGWSRSTGVGRRKLPSCTERDLRVILNTLATAVARGETDPATARRLWRAAVRAKA
jgi:hypothetical protein